MAWKEKKGIRMAISVVQLSYEWFKHHIWDRRIVLRVVSIVTDLQRHSGAIGSMT
jgi:hypothetical protein